MLIQDLKQPVQKFATMKHFALIIIIRINLMHNILGVKAGSVVLFSITHRRIYKTMASDTRRKNIINSGLTQGCDNPGKIFSTLKQNSKEF